MPEEQAPVRPVASSPKKGGARKLILIIVLLIVILGGGYAAYAKLVKKASISQIVSGNGLKLNPNCKYNDPDLCKFINNWKEVSDMTMVGETTAKDGSKSKMTIKNEGKDKSQMIIEDSGKETYNYITIGKTSYSKDYTDNQWFKYTYEESNDQIKTEESTVDFDTKADSTEDKTTYKKIGKEACGKYTCFKYQVIDPAITDSTQYIYFDNKEYQLRKMRNEMNDGSVDETTFDYSKVNISEPSPTKEGNPYSIGSTALTSDAAAAQAAAEAAASAAAAAAQSSSSSSYSPPTFTPEESADITVPETTYDYSTDTSE